MSATRTFVARLAGCPVFDRDGDRVGRLRDVLVVFRKNDPPTVVGLVVELAGKRRTFLPIGEVESISSGQVIIADDVEMHRFEQRGGEVRLLAEVIGRSVDFRDGSGRALIEDVEIDEDDPGEWAVERLSVRRPRTGGALFAKGPTVLADWDEVVERTHRDEPQSAEQLIATYSDLKPADLANTLLDLPLERRLEVAEELPDERLADVLEEMTGTDQLDVLERLDDDRVATVLDRMQPDDAADLIGQLPDDRGQALLELMRPEEADDVRMLLTYEPDTAGGLMTTEPIILSSDATVAEALALIRQHELAPALGAAVCITLPPFEPPTGRFLGMVHFQRMLRYPPHERLGTLLDLTLEPVHPETGAAEVSRILASYNLVSVPVVDDDHHLVGVVTIDDILDYLLPDDWRSKEGDDERRSPGVTDETSGIPLTRPRRMTSGTR